MCVVELEEGKARGRVGYGGIKDIKTKEGN